jgi:DNA polymerase III alpha subunit
LENSKYEQDPHSIIDSIQKDLHVMGIELLPPDLAKSKMGFSKEGKNIRYGLNSIKGISEKTLEAVIKFRNEEHPDMMNVFLAAKQSGINIAVLSSLIQAGTLTSISSNRVRMAFNAQVFNILTDREKRIFLNLGHKYNYDVVDIWKFEIKQGPNIDDNGKVLIKPSRQQTILKKLNPCLEIYKHNNDPQNRKVANWYFERKLLGYNYSSRLKDVVRLKGYCTGIEELRGELPNQKFLCVGIIKSIEQRRSRRDNKRYVIFNLSDEKHEITCFIWEEAIKKMEKECKSLPVKDDLVSVSGRTMERGGMSVDAINIIDTKIYMKVRELKDA